MGNYLNLIKMWKGRAAGREPCTTPLSDLGKRRRRKIAWYVAFSEEVLLENLEFCLAGHSSLLAFHAE